MKSPSELENELKTQGYDVVPMKHAYRINGCVDIWYNGKVVYDKPNNEYYRLNGLQECLKKGLKLADHIKKQEPFKKTSKGNMSYQEFKHKSQKSVAEYYHWKNDKGSSEDYLYFIKSGIYVKIGRSINPEKRLKELATGTPETPKLILVVPNKGHMEKSLHRCFKEWKTRERGEWFFLNDNIQEFIKFLVKEKSKPKKREYPASRGNKRSSRNIRMAIEHEVREKEIASTWYPARRSK